jgi:hypothetical protein
MDFYREIGELFGITLQSYSRWGGFKVTVHTPDSVGWRKKKSDHYDHLRST